MSIPPSPPRNSPVYLLPEGVHARWHILAPAIALAGGIFGIFGAFYTEASHGSFLLAFVGAPIIEESLKPCGVYFLLARHPRTLRSQTYTALLSAAGGVAFALVENLVYLHIYLRDPSPQLVLWRYTVCVALHAICSFVYGFGINQRLAASVKGYIPLLSTGKRFFVSAMILHSLYNISAAIFASRLGLE